MKDRSIEYKNGFDAGKNGNNTSNCHFTNFSTAEKKDHWEKGYKNGLRAKRRAENKPLMFGGVEYEVLSIEYCPARHPDLYLTPPKNLH